MKPFFQWQGFNDVILNLKSLRLKSKKIFQCFGIAGIFAVLA